MLSLENIFRATLLTVTISILGIPSQIQSAERLLTTPELAERTKESMVTIRQMDRRGGQSGIGSGFFISSDGAIVTNLHVIGEGRMFEITNFNKQKLEVERILGWSRLHDIAIIKVKKIEGIKALELSPSKELLKKGASVVAVGNPQGFENSIVEGVISQLRSFDKTKMYQIAIPIEPGNSGGPLIDRFGKAHGIITLKSVVTDNLGFAVNVQHIHELIANPNSIDMNQWVRLGEPNAKIWINKFGASWKTRHGSIRVTGSGQSFGGRSLLLKKKKPTSVPYEIRTRVKLSDESGAAGLVFGSDGNDKHWAYYPSNGNMRLTHFKGPDVYSWDIVQQVSTNGYQRDDWNDLKVRIEPEHIYCYLNGELIINHEIEKPILGHYGFAKFRNTEAEFKPIRYIPTTQIPDAELREKVLKDLIVESNQWEIDFLKSIDNERNSESITVILSDEADALQKRAQQLEKLSIKVRNQNIRNSILEEVKNGNFETSLAKSALMLGRYEVSDLNPSTYLLILEEMAEEILISLPDFASQEERVSHLIDYLFKKNGFRGSRNDYQNRANSFLNKVIEDREGLPITLSVLFIELGNRIFIDGLSGAELPGHFMVSWVNSEGEQRWIDPFEEGAILNAKEVSENIFGSPLRIKEVKAYKDASSKSILSRIIRNLANFEESPENLKYLDLLVSLNPDDHATRLLRIFEYINAEDSISVKGDLEYLIEVAPPELNLQRLKQFYEAVYGVRN